MIQKIRTVLRFVWDKWMRVVDASSWLMTRIALVVLFFTVFTLYRLAIGLLGWDPLDRRIDEDGDSYWTDYFVTNDSLDPFENKY